MSGFELFKKWLESAPGVSGYALREGDWFTFADSVTKRYISISTTGGRAPREVKTRYQTISVTIVGVKAELSAIIRAQAEQLIDHAESIPEQCGLVTVNALGPVIGPMQTQAGRPAVTLSFEIIT